MRIREIFGGALLVAFTISLTGGASLIAQDANVAVLGVAEQSTTGFGGDAPRGNDGNTDGVYGNGSVTHTATDDPEPWWRVDLLDIFELTRVVLWNRTDDCCPQRLSNFRVAVLDEDLSEVWGENFFTDGVSFPPPGEGFEIPLPVETFGAFVQVSLYVVGPPPTNRWLSLAEVQVFTSDPIVVPPTIDVPPQGGEIAVGAAFELSVTASGTPPLEYQWLKDGGDLPGADEATYSIAAATLGDAGAYQVRVSNEAGEVTSAEAALVVTPGSNLALCGIARQSSTGFEGTQDRANDGNTSGLYGNASVSHTAATDPAPTWEVELPETSQIEFIKIWNRTDCCAERLTDFSVAILDEGGGIVYEEFFFDDGFSFPDTTLDGYLIDVDGPLEGKTVRIALENVDLRDPAVAFLSLAEVQVFGTGVTDCEPPAHPSLAHRPEATATQSSMLGTFAPQLAQDDNPGTFTHTLAGDAAPTWEVDLGSVSPIEAIDIVNRTQCCASRLRDITVTVLAADGTTVVAQSELLNPENELGGGTLGAGPANLILTFDPPVGGQFVRIERTPDPDLSGTGGEGVADDMDVLSLAEVYVYPPTDCTVGDTHCLGLETVGEPADGGPGIYTFEVESSDDSEDVIRHDVTARDLDDPGAPPIRFRTANTRFAINLGYGNWEISLAAIDGTRCDTPAADSTCTVGVEIERDPCLLTAQPGVVATQSTTGFGGTPDRAIDGNTDGVYGNGSQSHTDTGDPAPWWEVDLGDELGIGSIVIWNRSPADCPCADRLNNFQVSVLAANRDVVWDDIFFEEPGTFPDTTVEGFTIDLAGDDVVGQIVRIEFVDPELRGQLWLTLAEVQVYCGDAQPQGVGPFLRGDCDGDALRNITDGVTLLNYLFLGGSRPPCIAACDNDGDGNVPATPTDALSLFNFLFLGGAPLPPPLLACARSTDPSDVALGCATPPANCP